MKKSLIHGLRTGTIFGIVVIFLLLIGFLNIVAGLLFQVIKITPPPQSGLTPLMVDMLIFLAVLGLWAGASSAKREKPDSWVKALVSGTLAGAMTGLMTAITIYIIGTLDEAGVKLTTYLAALVPEVIDMLMLNRAPLDAALTYFVLFLITGIAGALLARLFRQGTWREALTRNVRNGIRVIGENPTVIKIRLSPVTRYVGYALLLIFLFTAPFRIGQYWNYTVGTVGIYVLLGLGLNIVVGLAGLLDLGYVAFFAIGAYTMALLTAPEPHHLQWGFWTALLIGVGLAALTGILLGIPVLRMRGDYLAIVTLGFGEIINRLSKSDVLTPLTGGPRGVMAIPGPTLFGKPFSNDVDFVILILLAILLVIFVTTRLQHSRVGRAWVAMREDETVAQATGINTMVHKLLAFSIGAAFAGLGGAIFASRNAFTGPEDHVLMVSINVLCVVIVGGMGSIPGVIAGAFVLKGLPEILRQLENYRILFFGALLVVMMIWRPEGMIPSRRRRLEMHTEPDIPPQDAEGPGIQVGGEEVET
jgi:ABC-type branched-subunit amino acid transport system permease subunit